MKKRTQQSRHMLFGCIQCFFSSIYKISICIAYAIFYRNACYDNCRSPSGGSLFTVAELNALSNYAFIL